MLHGGPRYTLVKVVSTIIMDSNQLSQPQHRISSVITIMRRAVIHLIRIISSSNSLHFNHRNSNQPCLSHSNKLSDLHCCLGNSIRQCKCRNIIQLVVKRNRCTLMPRQTFHKSRKHLRQVRVQSIMSANLSWDIHPYRLKVP